MSRYSYSSPIHLPMTESSSGLPVSEPSLPSSSRRESLTRSVPRPYSSTGLYSPLFRDDHELEEPSPLYEHYPRHPLPHSSWTPEQLSYEEELRHFRDLPPQRRLSHRIPSGQSRYSTQASALPRDPYMIDHLPSSSLHPSEHYLSYLTPSRHHSGSSRYGPSLTHRDHYSGRNVGPTPFALKSFEQDINPTARDPYSSTSSSSRALASPDPYGIEVGHEEHLASGTSEFFPELSPFERNEFMPRSGLQGQQQVPEQDLQQLMIGGDEGEELGMMGEDPTNPENWPDTKDNDIVKRAKTMYTMAYSMYQFTRGEGELKTTQDLFTQAEFLTEEANKFYKVVRQFTYQVPSGQMKKDLLEHLNNVPTFVQQLQFSVKNSTVGKAATFTKVDNIIQETKDLMNFISKTVNSCLACAAMYNLEMVSRTRSRTLSPSGRGGSYDYDDDRMGSKGGGSSSDASL